MIVSLTNDKEEPIVVYQEDWKTKEVKKLKIYLNVKNHKYGKSVCYFIGIMRNVKEELQRFKDLFIYSLKEIFQQVVILIILTMIH